MFKKRKGYLIIAIVGIILYTYILSVVFKKNDSQPDFSEEVKEEIESSEIAEDVSLEEEIGEEILEDEETPEIKIDKIIAVAKDIVIKKLMEENEMLKEENEKLKQEKETEKHFLSVYPKGETITKQVYKTDKYISIKLFQSDDLTTEEEQIWFFQEISHIAYNLTGDKMFAVCAAAHASTESGWGKSSTSVYVKSNNLFGAMATSSWTGRVYGSARGRIYESYSLAKKDGNGVVWRVYDTIEDSILAYYNRAKSCGAIKQSSYRQYYLSLYKSGYFNHTYIIDIWTSRIKDYSPFVKF